MLAAWAAAALAVLSKGLVGVVLPALALLAYVALRRERALLGRLHLLAGGAVLLLISAPWFAAVQERNPEFFHFFFIREHLQRFAEPGHHRPGPWWYYIPIMIVGLMPWTPAMLKEGMTWLKNRRPHRGGFSTEWFCAVWVGVIVLFFSASHSKLPAYILPVLPAIALVFARGIQTRGPDSIEWSAWGAVLGGGALLGLVPLLPDVASFAALGEDAIRQIPWLYAAAGSLLASGMAALWTFRRKRAFRAVVMLVAGTFGFWQMVFGFLHAIDASVSSERLIESLTDNRTPYHPELPFYSVAQFDDSVPFYLERTVTLVATRGELGPGIDAEPDKAIPSFAHFAKLWRAQKGQAFAILRPDTLEYFLQRGLPMTEMTSDRRLVIVGKQAETR